MTREPIAPVSVSVIVPFRNPGALFAALLESLAVQRVDAPTEIVAVDNGSRNGSRRYAEAFEGRIPLRIVDAFGRANRSAARNRGAREARGDKLLFVDADDALAPGYLAAMSAALATHDFVTSSVDSAALNAPWLRRAHGEPWSGLMPSAFGFLPSSGINIGIRKALFEAVGGFSEQLQASEDIAFCWAVHLAGVELRPVPEAVYLYRHRPTVVGLFRQSVFWGSSNVQLYRMFRVAGMPGRSTRQALEDWRHALRHTAGARSKSAIAAAAVELGHCVGRLFGSVRHRAHYF